MAEGQITRKDIITDEGLNWGPEYARNLQIAIDKNNELIKSSKELFSLYKQIQGASDTKQLNTLQTKQIQITQTATKAYEDQGKALAKVDEERQKSLASLLRTTNRLQNVNTQTNKQNIEARETLRLQNLEIKRNLTFMGRLTNERDKARKSVQELQAKLALGKKLSDQEQKELRESTKLFEEYNKKVQAIKKSTGQFQENVGNYPKFFSGAIKSIKSFLPLIGAGFGLREAFNFAKEARQLAIEAKGVEFAFDRLGDTGVDAFERVKASTRGLLSDLDIKKALVDFDNFNLSLEESDTLFEFLAVRAAQTGQSIEQLQSSLVEGLSKESKLRIDNLGISATELNAELEKTPDFVQAVANIAKREIAEAGSVLDDAGNSQQKFNAAYQNFQLAIGKGLVAKASDAMYDLGRNILDVITPTKTLVTEIEKEQTELNLLVNKITDVNTSNEERERLIGNLKTQYPAFLQFLNDEKTDNESLSTALAEVNQLYIKRIALQQQQETIEELLQKSGKEAFRQAKAQVEVDKEIIRINNTVLKGSIDLTNKSYQERIDAVTEALEVNARFSESQRTGVRTALNSEAKALQSLNSDIGKTISTKIRQNRVNKELTEQQDLMLRLEENMGTTLEEINALFAANTAAKTKNANATGLLTDKEQKALEQRKKQLEQDAFNLDKQRLQSQADAQKRILDSDSETTSKRLAASVNYTNKSIELLQLERDRAIKLAKGRTDEITRINEAYSDDYDALIREREDNVQGILQDSFEKTKARIEAENQLQQDATNKRINEAQARLRTDLETLNGPARLARIQAYEDEVTQIERNAAEERLNNQIAVIEKELANPMLDPEQRIALEQMLADAKIALSDEQTDNAIANAERQAEAEQRLFDMKQQLLSQSSQSIADSLGLDAQNIESLFTSFLQKAESTGDAVIDKYNEVSRTLSQIGSIGAVTGDILQSVFDANIQGIDEQIDAQEEYYDRQIELAGEDESQREALELEREARREALEKKKRDEQVKAAKFAKAQSVFQIGLNTAQAILGIWAQVPKFDFGISAGLLTTFVAGLGAAQIAAVLAKPIPKHRYGTEDHPGGLAEVAEVRPEVIMEPGKKPYIQKTRATLNLAPHTKVIPSVDEFSNQMISASIMTSLAHEKHNLNHYETLLAFEKYSGDMVDELKNNTRAVKALKLGVNIRNEKYDIPYQLFRSQNIKW